MNLADTSNTLFITALLAYLVAMVAYFFRLAFTRVSVEGVAVHSTAGNRVGLVGTGLALAGLTVHAASVVTRGLAAGRVPWANMYEYSSLLALVVVLVGLAVVQRRMGYGHLMGFVLAAAVLSMTVALLLFTPAGPVVPALNSYWIKIHTSAAMIASAIFTVGFVANSLYLLKDVAERRVAGSGSARFTGSTVGAASVRPADAPADRPEGYVGEVDPDGERAAVGVAASAPQDSIASPLAQRDALSPVWFPAVPFVVVAAFTVAVWRAPVAALVSGTIAALLGTAAWYAVPYLPPAARLDNLTYRTIAFGFPIWTFAVMAGAVWAEEAWGRYWGWDPKETGSFFTWVLYAGYLHARSTHGWRGRGAGWVGVISFAALMVTYFVVNLFVTGLHSYAGV